MASDAGQIPRRQRTSRQARQVPPAREPRNPRIHRAAWAAVVALTAGRNDVDSRAARPRSRPDSSPVEQAQIVEAGPERHESPSNNCLIVGRISDTVVKGQNM